MGHLECPDAVPSDVHVSSFESVYSLMLPLQDLRNIRVRRESFFMILKLYLYFLLLPQVIGKSIRRFARCDISKLSDPAWCLS